MYPAVEPSSVRLKACVCSTIGACDSRWLRLACTSGDAHSLHTTRHLTPPPFLSPPPQPALRKHVKRAFTTAARALEVAGSPLHRLRAQLHYEVARCEAAEDALVKVCSEGCVDRTDVTCKRHGHVRYGLLLRHETADNTIALPAFQICRPPPRPAKSLRYLHFMYCQCLSP